MVNDDSGNKVDSPRLESEKAVSDAGMSSRVKEAFTSFVGTGICEIKPITQQLKKFCQRPQAERFRIAPSRMVDDVEAMLKSIWRNDNDNNEAVDACLPVIVIAFGSAMRPAQPSRGWSRVQGEPMLLTQDDSVYYDTRLAFKEWDVQIAVFAHEQESITCIMDFLRMYFFRFKNHRWPIAWKHDGKPFNTWGMLSDGFEVEEMAVPISGRTNIICHAFNFPITFMMPYIADEVPTIKSVDMQIEPNSNMKVKGIVTSQTEQDWPSC